MADEMEPHYLTLAGTTLSNPRPLGTFPWLMGCYLSRTNSSRYHLYGRNRKAPGKVAFQYTLSGLGIFRDRHGEHHMNPGKGFLVQVDHPEYEYYFPSKAETPWSFLWCDIRGGHCDKQASELIERYGHVFTLPDGQGIMSKLSQFITTPLISRPMEAASNSLLVNELFCALATAGEGEQALTPSEALVRDAIAAIQGSVRPTNVSALADDLGVSREHLTRVFRQELKRSPGVVLAEARLEATQLDLRLSSRPVEEIAISHGFSSAAHICAVFKRSTGMTPGKYRALLQGEPTNGRPSGRHP